MSTPSISTGEWRKQGRIISGVHCQIPVVDPIGSGVLRVYVTDRDEQNRARIISVDVEESLPKSVLSVNEPILSHGHEDEFDSHGAMTGSMVYAFGSSLFYYTGWGRVGPNPYSLGIGMIYKGTKHLIMGPSGRNNYACCSPFVLFDGGVFRMWYISSENRGWMRLENADVPLYSMRYGESNNGIDWTDKPLNFPVGENEVFARPFVRINNGVYEMWYTYMTMKVPKRYKIGYAVSSDGISWNRSDLMSGITISETGWDSEMIAFPYIHRTLTHDIMFYSGNQFGKDGFGYAVR
jgi:hypothetical protein